MSYRADKQVITAHTDGRTDTQTDAGNDNTQRPKLASGKNMNHENYAAWKDPLEGKNVLKVNKNLLKSAQKMK